MRRKYGTSGAVDCDSLMVSNGELLISIVSARVVAAIGYQLVDALVLTVFY